MLKKLADLGESLVREVLVRPDEDFPRLVYADWLDDHGDHARAEFVRVQCELATIESRWKKGSCGTASCTWPNPVRKAEWCPDCDRSAALHRRERELLECNPAWYVLPPGGPITTELRRGFIESVTLPLAAFLEHAAALFAAAPVTEVRLRDREPRGPGRGAWAWYVSRYDDSPIDTSFNRPHWLPPCLGAALGNPACRGRTLYHPTADAARVDLSRRCVAYGRRAAGLE